MNDPIKQKIQELVPNKEWIEYDEFGSREIIPTLADILRAMEKISDETRVWMGVLTTGQMFHNSPHNDSNAFYQIIDCTWNLTTDYDGQTQEVKAFIGTLLGVTGTN